MSPILDIIFSIGTLGLIGFSILVLLAWIILPQEHSIRLWLGKHIYLIISIATLGAMVGSLIYSEIIGYPPCRLCWVQRFFVYPIPFLLGIPLLFKKKDWIQSVIPYALPMTIIGGIVAIYHILLENGVFDSVNAPCAADAISCSARYVQLWGFITIPVMSLSIFVFIFILFVYKEKSALGKAS